MTSKCYRHISLAIVTAAGVICSVAVILKLYWLFPLALLLGAGTHLILIRRAPHILTDERDDQIAGQAALTAVKVFAWTAFTASFLLFLFQRHAPLFAVIGTTLTFSALGISIFFGLISAYLARNPQPRHPGRIAAGTAIILVVLTIASLRLLSGEDDWMCVGGKWVPHGHPDAPAPTEPCPAAR